MRMSDWSSDVCSSGLAGAGITTAYLLIEQIGGGDPGARTADRAAVGYARAGGADRDARVRGGVEAVIGAIASDDARIVDGQRAARATVDARGRAGDYAAFLVGDGDVRERTVADAFGEVAADRAAVDQRSEEHTSELQSLMR